MRRAYWTEVQFCASAPSVFAGSVVVQTLLPPCRRWFRQRGWTMGQLDGCDRRADNSADGGKRERRLAARTLGRHASPCQPAASALANCRASHIAESGSKQTQVAISVEIAGADGSSRRDGHVTQNACCDRSRRDDRRGSHTLVHRRGCPV